MIRIEVKLPVIVHVNNTGAIFMGKNVMMSSQTKHVDIHTKYVHAYWKMGL